jgi:hypothetical protein
MTVHKLSAGDSYTYMTRQVGSADQVHVAGADLAGYCSRASGFSAGLLCQSNFRYCRFEAYIGLHPEWPTIRQRLDDKGTDLETAAIAIEWGFGVP